MGMKQGSDSMCHGGHAIHTNEHGEHSALFGVIVNGRQPEYS